MPPILIEGAPVPVEPLDPQRQVAALAWVRRQVGSATKLVSSAPLTGATSSTLLALRLECWGQPLELVLRLFTNAEWLAEEPDLATHEATILRLVAALGLPTPRLVAVDEDGASCGVPAVLMTRVPGHTDLRPKDLDTYLHELAAALAAIHALPADDLAWTYFPYADLTALRVPPWARQPQLWERMIAVLAGPRPAVPTRFIHRDYHPNNVLWRGARLSGIIDWPNACLGPAQADLAHCRGNLIGLFGMAAADRFLDAYCGCVGTGFRYDPYWELLSLTDCLPGPPDVYQGWIDHGVRHLTAELLLERCEERLARALAAL
jgi:aminoglycoside phosphotransferase (APT) family kinase protein